MDVIDFGNSQEALVSTLSRNKLSDCCVMWSVSNGRRSAQISAAQGTGRSLCIIIASARNNSGSSREREKQRRVRCLLGAAHRFNLQGARSAAKAIFCIAAYRQPALHTCPTRSLCTHTHTHAALARGMAIFSAFALGAKVEQKSSRRTEREWKISRRLHRALVRTNRSFYLRHK